ncbi:MAG TPA: coproporphyrinogen III oxidase, partial [Sulfitobacter pontiacus]|nr:coproporphyrinogen III oxidase [Sulfitobacter pontiacus]
MTVDFEAEKTRAAEWFRSLRDQIVEAFETLERDHAEGP